MGEIKNDNNSGCFFFIAVICGAILVFNLINYIFKSVSETFKKDPGFVMGLVLIVGVISFFIYKAKEK